MGSPMLAGHRLADHDEASLEGRLRFVSGNDDPRVPGRAVGNVAATGALVGPARAVPWSERREVTPFLYVHAMRVVPSCQALGTRIF